MKSNDVRERNPMMALSHKLTLLVLPLFAACAAVPAPAPALAPQYYAQYQTKVMVSMGTRSLDSAFEPVDDQTVLGIELDVRQPNASSGLELGLFYSQESQSKDIAGFGEVDYEASMLELSVGGRWYHDQVFLTGRPYAAAGASLLCPEYTSDPVSGPSTTDDGWSVGPYARLGMEWMVGDHVSLALDYRLVLFSDLVHGIDLGNSPADTNYQQFGIVLGWSF
ncbi:MAG: outer membrane beta-barrel protein [Planctomycetota bacterium]|nr:outer membrane beta-barrel protein [Planctomycetota bacterium]